MQIVQIKKESPVEIVLYCVIPMLSLAVVISGGEISYEGGKFKCKVPALGEGIRKLRAAFGASHRAEDRIAAGMQTLAQEIGSLTGSATTTGAMKKKPSPA